MLGGICLTPSAVPPAPWPLHTACTQGCCVVAAGEEVFSARRNLFFKYVHVRRVFDADHNALVYIGYSSRFGGDFEDQHAQYRTSVAALSLEGQQISLPA